MQHLEVRSLTKVFDDGNKKKARVLNNISFNVEKGQFVTILGPSGCGKTTVLRIIAGLENPTSGSVHLAGRDITLLPPNKRDTAMVFQHYALFPHMDVYHNIAFGLKYKRHMSETEIKERVYKFLNLVGLEEFATRQPSQLSGGQQQRVALARALVMEPAVLLCDEPLSNLDKKLRVQMREEIRKLTKRVGSTTVYVTHDNEEACALSDRVIVMDNGTIAAELRPEDIT